MVGPDLSHLQDGWIRNIALSLDRTKELLICALHSDDEATRRSAEDRTSKINAFICPAEPLPKDRRQGIIESLMREGGLSAPQARAAATLASRVTGRRRGCPPSRPVPQVLAALMFHLLDGRSYREITLMLDGPCEHTCPECGDVIRITLEGSGAPIRKPRRRCAQCCCTIRPDKQKERVCHLCAEATRHRIMNLKKSLHSMGVDQRLLRRTELSHLSTRDLEVVWP